MLIDETFPKYPSDCVQQRPSVIGDERVVVRTSYAGVARMTSLCVAGECGCACTLVRKQARVAVRYARGVSIQCALPTLAQKADSDGSRNGTLK